MVSKLGPMGLACLILLPFKTCNIKSFQNLVILCDDTLPLLSIQQSKCDATLSLITKTLTIQLANRENKRKVVKIEPKHHQTAQDITIMY